MTRPPFVLVGGGARSGKSRFALARAAALGARPLFVATAESSDDEMRDRIARHRDERGGRFTTVEEPLALPAVVSRHVDPAGGHDAVLIDCLTLWLSNLLVHGATAETTLLHVEELRGVLSQRRVPVVLVTNEVGMGLVPETPLGRVFRDVSGMAHQRLAGDADELYLCTLGTVLRLRPGPVAVIDPAA